MKKGAKIIFLREKVIHSRNPEVTPHQVTLVEVPAVYVSESEAWCGICHEPKEGHERGGRRKHAFTAETLATIEVHYPDEEKEIRHHVPQGDTANCWKEK